MNLLFYGTRLLPSTEGRLNGSAHHKRHSLLLFNVPSVRSSSIKMSDFNFNPQISRTWFAGTRRPSLPISVTSILDNRLLSFSSLLGVLVFASHSKRAEALHVFSGWNRTKKTAAAPEVAWKLSKSSSADFKKP